MFSYEICIRFLYQTVEDIEFYCCAWLRDLQRECRCVVATSDEHCVETWFFFLGGRWCEAAFYSWVPKFKVIHTCWAPSILHSDFRILDEIRMENNFLESLARGPCCRAVPHPCSQRNCKVMLTKYCSALCPSLVLKGVRGIPAFLREYDEIPCNSWESVESGFCVPRKGVCCRAHVGKWAAREQQLRNARCMQAVYCWTCSVVQVYSRVCSRPSAFTSRRNVMTSAHFPTCAEYCY